MRFIKYLGNLAKKAFLINELSAGADYLKTKTKYLFALKNSDNKTPFEELSNYGVTPGQLRLCKEQFFKLACFYLVFAIFLFLYMGFMIAKRHYSVAILVLSLVSICAAQAFKYHFWYFQIREQKLGCSFAEWLSYLLRKRD